jgi:radical SAM protein with 4Fe4S-binding SPASM domain
MGHSSKQMITLFTSAVCNLNCGYCYAPREKTIREDHKKINVDFARLAIRDYFEQTQNYYIRFFGAGEPTIAFDEMKAIHEFSKNLSNNNLKTELQTNGYFDDIVADWIEKNVDVLWISFDGLPSLQDKQRPTQAGLGSSDIVISNIKRFANNKNMQFGVRATITNDNFHKQIEMIEYLSSIGVTYVCGSPCYSSTANKNVSTPRTSKFAECFVPAYEHAKKMGMFYQTHFIVNFNKNEKAEAYCRACVPSPHVTTDGFISCCDWALFGPEYLPGPLQELVYGRYDPIENKIIYDKNKIKRIEKRNVKTLEKGACKGCAALYQCAGGCIAKTIVVTNDLYTPSDEWCSATRYLLKNLPPNQDGFPCFHS